MLFRFSMHSFRSCPAPQPAWVASNFSENQFVILVFNVLQTKTPFV